MNNLIMFINLMSMCYINCAKKVYEVIICAHLLKDSPLSDILVLFNRLLIIICLKKLEIQDGDYAKVKLRVKVRLPVAQKRVKNKFWNLSQRLCHRLKLLKFGCKLILNLK